MSAAETITAAIRKLESLKAQSTQPTDGTSWIQGSDRKPFETSGEVYSGPLSDTSSDVATWVSPADADLIVTLHRTIDAQLAILRETQRWQDLFDQGLIPDTGNADLDCARAILGEVTPDAS